MICEYRFEVVPHTDLKDGEYGLILRWIYDGGFEPQWSGIKCRRDGPDLRSYGRGSAWGDIYPGPDRFHEGSLVRVVR